MAGGGGIAGPSGTFRKIDYVCNLLQCNQNASAASGGAAAYDAGMDAAAEDLTLSAFQKHVSDRYEKHDRARGTPGTWLHFSEEIGELARAIHVASRWKLKWYSAHTLAIAA